MATATMATAAGAAALLYYTLNKKLQSGACDMDEVENGGHDNSNGPPLGIERVSTRLIRAPATWLETISTLSETLRFTYSETLGKWPIGDLAFGISFLLKRQVCLSSVIMFSSYLMSCVLVCIHQVGVLKLFQLYGPGIRSFSGYIHIFCCSCYITGRGFCWVVRYDS